VSGVVSDDDQPEAHVRHERATREAWNMVGVDADLGPRCVAFCGARADNHWFFTSVDHVVHTLIASTAITPCRLCLVVIREVIDRELRGEV
jgi:hypothetical protein